MILATKLAKAIDEALVRDDGRTYRGFLKEAILACSDAFETKIQGPREHLGCSLLGRKCARELWYSFRWATLKDIPARIHRLFNRGHLEEGRFVALLRMVGLTTLTHDANTGKQFRVKGHLNHVGGSLDGVVMGIPDLPLGTWALQEFKTHNEKSYKKLISSGVREAKPEHYVQQQLYATYYGLPWSLYGAVCKNDDDIHWELVENDGVTGPQYFERGAMIVDATVPPPKISDSPGWFECKFCDHAKTCHGSTPMLKNCRTCRASRPIANGEWICLLESRILSYEAQIAACHKYDQIKG